MTAADSLAALISGAPDGFGWPDGSAIAPDPAMAAASSTAMAPDMPVVTASSPRRTFGVGADSVDFARRLDELRAAFDRSFADPPRAEVAGHDDLLAVRAGGRRYALRLTQAAGLFPDRPVTRLPGPVPALLGVAGFRGAIVPVYSLAAVFGTRGTTAASQSGNMPRWLVLAAGLPPVALAFDELDGHLRVPSDALVEETDGHGPHGCLRGIVPLDGGSLPIVDIPAVRAAVLAAVGRYLAPPTEDTDATGRPDSPPPAPEGA